MLFSTFWTVADSDQHSKPQADSPGPRLKLTVHTEAKFAALPCLYVRQTPCRSIRRVYMYVWHTHACMHTQHIHAHTHERAGFQPFMKSQEMCKLACIFTCGSPQWEPPLYNALVCLLHHNPTPTWPLSFRRPAWAWETHEFPARVDTTEITWNYNGAF